MKSLLLCVGQLKPLCLGIIAAAVVWAPTALAQPATFVDSGQLLGSSSTRRVSLGDLDGDGYVDAFTANIQGPNEVWFNDGYGVFDEVLTLDSPYLESSAVGLGDLDGDGDVDAYVTNSPGGNIVWLNDGTGWFEDSGQSLGYSNSTDVELADVDGDGDLDAFVTNANQPDRLWLNNGDGSFFNSGQSLGYFINGSHTNTVSLGDVDGDGAVDAFLTGAGGGGVNSNRVWLNDGLGVFFDSGQRLANNYSGDSKLGDLDGDGDLDAFVSNQQQQGNANRVWLNDGTGVFVDRGQALGNLDSLGVALGDLDGDGDLDAMVVACPDAGTPNEVWLNDGVGTFSDSGQRLGSSYSTDVALADLDLDGDLDAFVANYWGTANTVWLNQTAIFMDEDDDGVADEDDNCPLVFNPEQEDADSDDVGDVCDECPLDFENDIDDDGVCGDADNCPTTPNPDQLNTDGMDDGGDACDDDDDDDDVSDEDDNCPLVPNAAQLDYDEDGVGDACDYDDDGDGVLDGSDRCLTTPLGEPIDAEGCSVPDLCPCENAWKNHGVYVSCVAHAAGAFRAADLISEAEKDILVSVAGESDCGHKG